MMFFELRLLLTLLHMKFKVIWSDVRMIPSLIDLMLVATHLIAHYNHQKCANHHWTPWPMAHDDTKQGAPEEQCGLRSLPPRLTSIIAVTPTAVFRTSCAAPVPIQSNWKPTTTLLKANEGQWESMYNDFWYVCTISTPFPSLTVKEQ